MAEIISIPIQMYVTQNQYNRLSAFAGKLDLTPESAFELIMQAGSVHLVDDRLAVFEAMAEKSLKNELLAAMPKDPAPAQD